MSFVKLNFVAKLNHHLKTMSDTNIIRIGILYNMYFLIILVVGLHIIMSIIIVVALTMIGLGMHVL